jgi:PAS domain S-box-containing protein
MDSSGNDPGKMTRAQECLIQCQVAFASGVFQGDVTIRTILESLVEGVIIIENSGIILVVNSSLGKMFGYRREELVGKHHAMLFPERFRETGSVTGPDRVLRELAGLRRDGSEFPLEMSLGLIGTINGDLTLALISDISRRKEAEKHLCESEELFHLQIERVKDYAIFTLDTGGHVLNWNSGAERLKGYRAADIIGKHFSCLYPEEARAAGKPEQMLRRATAEGQATDEGWRIRKDGSRFWADVIITALHDENGKLRGFSKVTRDITKRKQAEEELRRSDEKFLGLFEHAPFGIFQTSPDGRFTKVNATLAGMFGYQSPEQMAASVLDVSSQLYVDSGQRYRLLQTALAADRYAQGEVEFRRKDGSHFSANLHIRSVNGADDSYVEGFVEDIGSRKEAEEALRKSELQFRRMAESIDEVFWLTSPGQSSVLYVNPAYERIWGRTCAELYQNPGAWMESIVAEDISRVRGDLQKLHSGSAVEMEYRIKRDDGAVRWISDRSYPLRDDSGVVILATGVATDITVRKQLEETLRTSESKLRIIFENEVYAICIFEVDSGRMLDANQAHVFMYGYSREELCSGMSAFELSAEPDKSRASVQTIGQTGPMFVPLRYHRKKDGTIFPVEIVGGAYLWEGRRVMFGLVHDITERVKAETTLKLYAQRLIVQEEDLRKRISTELHDDIGQELAALGFNLAFLGSHLPEETRADLRSVLEDSRLLTKKVSRFVRTMMVDLRPAQLDEIGLAPALRSYADLYARRSALSVSVQIPPEFPRLPATTEIALFRIAQEALTNVAKYAAAKQVTISLDREGTRVRLSVVDDGRGFLPRETTLQPTGSGWGLTIMRERTELLGGRFLLDTKPGTGTSIVVEVGE